MPTSTRHIGLSLGADLCWPQCFEDILRELDPCVRSGNDELRFAVERVTIEPFSLRAKPRYDLVIDRLTHWYSTSREWIKKIVLMDGVYVFNNPWSVQSMEKQTSYCAMMQLGLPIPATWLVPPKEYESSPDLQPTLERYAKLFDLGIVGSELRYPLFMKPYDGGGWVGVNKIDDEEALRKRYEESGKFVMHLQAGVEPHEEFVRCVGLGPQVRQVRYDPSAALHERYRADRDFLAPEDASLLEDITLTVNGYFGWDFNSCESLLADGTWHPIDFANPCPDSQVTSLNVHFPWLVLANLRWGLFCAAIKKKVRPNLDWAPYHEVAQRELPYRERVAAYADITRERMEAARFEEFCQEHLADLDAVAYDYFASERAKNAIRSKVEALFPEHEWEQFTEYFWSKIQDWRNSEGRAATERTVAPAAAPKANSGSTKASAPGRRKTRKAGSKKASSKKTASKKTVSKKTGSKKSSSKSAGSRSKRGARR